MQNTYSIGGPLKLEAKFTISGSTQAGIIPKPAAPNVGGPLQLKPEFEAGDLTAERKPIGGPSNERLKQPI